MWYASMWSDLRLRTKGLIVVAVPAAATILIACAVHVLGTHIVNEEDRVRHSLQVSKEIQRLKAAETDMTAEARAYFLTADESFADKAHDTIGAFNITLQTISNLTFGDAEQTRRLSEIQTIQLRRTERIFGAIARFHSNVLTREDLRAVVRAAEVRRLELAEIFKAMEAHEGRLLGARLLNVDRLRAQREEAVWLCVAVSLVGCLCMSLLFAAGITSRVRQLQANMARLACGGVLSLLPGGRDEIGELSQGMTRTARILRKRSAALEHALHGIAEANADGCCLEFNRAYAELAGLAVRQATTHIVETVHPDDHANVEAAVRRMWKDGRAETEARIVHAGGAVVDVVMTFIPASEDHSGGYYLFLRDDHARKEAEVVLVRAKDAAVASNAAKSGFLAKISHDIRTPLNAILGAAEMLSQTPLSPDQSEYVGMFNRNSKRLVVLINDFLDFSRIEAGAFRLQKESSRIRETVDDAVATFRPTALRKRIELGVEIDSNIPEWVIVDSSRIQQVLVNLLSNAIKFTSEGRVDVRVCRTGPHGEDLGFEVSDTGPGINPADRERIFAPFEQLPGQDADDRGCGLGLAICRELVGLMGGTINMSSRSGSGSTFHFSLPLEAGAAAGTVFPTGASVPGGRRPDQPTRILVAEDAVDNRLLIDHYLRGEPVEIEFAKNGQEAVEVSRLHEFDLILMDIDMPVLNGHAATKLILAWEAERGAAPTPIVALSADAMREAEQASRAAGCLAHIAKPIERSALLRTIHQYARPKRVRGVPRLAGSTLAEGVAPLVSAYLASKPDQIEGARASLAMKEFESIQRFGHNLKGTGGGYGFPLIEELGIKIENAASARDEDCVTVQLDALQRVVRQEADALLWVAGTGSAASPR